MNLAIHGLNANLGLDVWGDTFARDLHEQLIGHDGADYVLANPPFNIKDWARNEPVTHAGSFGVPPAGNANYAWIQHILYKLRPGGSAGCGDVERLDDLERGRRRQDPRAARRGRPRGLHGRLTDPAVPLTPASRPALWFFAKGKGTGRRG